MVAFQQGLAWVVVASLVSGAGIGLLSPALTVVVQNSVPVARMGSATTSQQLIRSLPLSHPNGLPVYVARFPSASFIRQVGAALGVSAFVLAATAGGFRLGLLLMIGISAGAFACILALPAHSLRGAHKADPE
jgi:hypothetical protein